MIEEAGRLIDGKVLGDESVSPVEISFSASVFERSKFLNNLSIGLDISSTNINGSRRTVLDHALNQHNAVMFGVQMDEHGALVVSNGELTQQTEDESRGKTLLLNETMEACRSKHARVVINVLHYNSDLLNEVISYVRKYDLLSDVVVTSFNPLVPLSIKKKESRILTGLRIGCW
ncbi:hypothetical protein COOONC_26427 [Cooperia oncophora]